MCLFHYYVYEFMIFFNFFFKNNYLIFFHRYCEIWMDFLRYLYYFYPGGSTWIKAIELLKASQCFYEPKILNTET